MKRNDIFALLFVAVLVAFFSIPVSREWYNSAYHFSPVLLSFLKFAVLATFGEMLVMRFTKGHYYEREFGWLPKTMIWGMLGIGIYCAFVIFSQGVPALLFKGMKVETFGLRLVNAFGISCFMNIMFAPGMMLTHHITDIFIAEQKGRFPLSRFSPLALLKMADWNTMWGFVFKKTIPLFWIPAHTITFLLPPEFRVLFAAVLSIVLGLFLAMAKKKN